MSDLFRNPSFVYLWASRLVSRLGDWVLDVVLPIWVYQLTGSAAALGVMVVIESLPGLLLAPLVGVYVDRWNRKYVLMVGNLLLGLAILPLFLVRSAETLFLVYGVALLNACLGLVVSPAQSAWVPELLPSAQLQRANSILVMTVHTTRFVGPVLGGILITLATPQLAIALDALSFLVAALLIALIPEPEQSSTIESPQKPNLYRDMVAGMVVIRSHPLLSIKLAVWAVMMGASGAVGTVLLVFVRTVLDGSDASYGYILAGQGLGMVVGGLWVMAMGDRLKPLPAFAWGLLAFGIVFLLGVNTSQLWVAGILVCALGFTAPMVAISDSTITQLVAPPAFRGRVFATHEAVTSLMFLTGAGLAGFFSEVVGVRVVLNGAAVLTLLAAMLAMRLLKLELPVSQPYEGAMS